MKRLALVVGCIVALLLVTAIAVPFFIDPNRFRALLEQQLTQALARDVKVGNLKLSILAGAVTADDLSIADNPAYSRQPFVQAKSLAVSVELWPLIASRQVHVTGIAIDHPAIALIQSAGGEWNFSNLGRRSAAAPKPAATASSTGSLDLSVKLLKITGGRFSLDRSGGRHKPLVLDDVNFQVNDFSPSAAFPFTLTAQVIGGGTVKVDGTAGPLDSDDVSASPVRVNFDIAKLDLVGTGAAQDAPALAGVVSLAGTLQSDGKTGQIKAKFKGDKLKFARTGTAAKPTVELEMAAVRNLRTRSGRIEQGDIHLGSAVAHLTGTYADQNGLTSVHMTLEGSKMPIPDLADMLPPAGIVLPNGSSLQGGTATLKFTMEGVLDKLVTSGSISFDNTKLAGFDMGKKLSTIEKFAGIKGGPDTEIQTLASGIQMGPDGIVASNMQLIVPAIGTVNGNGTVSPANALDFKMVATAHTSGLMAAVGNTPIPFTVGGTAQDPVFRPDVKAVVKGEAGKAAGSILKGLLGGK
ncbi:MAG TPA: AsmA family protein [Verrucomicrobiae bacterium]|nr:AsmA family protein [Verrucomicrobiae bacterium]